MCGKQEIMPCMREKDERQNIYKKKQTLGQVGKKRVASVWKQIKSLNKSTTIIELVKENLVSP